MHRIAVVALPNSVASDVATPVDVFGRTQLSDGKAGYRVQVCGTAPEVRAGPMRIATDHRIDALGGVDTIVVPGCHDPLAHVPDELIVALKTAYDNGIRIASICTGAFVLAAAGLLDGKRATTHWLAAANFQRAYPTVDLDPDVLYVDEGQILTSAGASAGLDLCLHMVALDHGAAVAAQSARLAVAPLHRSGGQAQFIMRNQQPQPPDTEFGDLLGWIETHADQPLTLRDLAAQASISIRTLNRRFQVETRQTPMQWVTGVRIRHAQQLLERTSDSVETISAQVGFSSAANFRDQFKRMVGVPPQAYRATFRTQTKNPNKTSLQS
ncbi:helix-turn-helix domain-containing protein [Mycolicibacterium smegmatis]|uniref:GlxA family transcriptional regulator n=1 Tax=Mycolicibacterium smegmatis TaxID=1772 RepID=UPI001E43D2DB|nr:helix-turn-helix domain-containing protein [Mycolicibacterium smegmatis]UGU29395.1 helix-turn-helix domain-containing protein [Mycolicibacterium smegmatis]ULN70356.1 helix-turn-helix domain-containing protein [Mycolicibacterium smegmatis]